MPVELTRKFGDVNFGTHAKVAMNAKVASRRKRVLVKYRLKA